MRIGLIAMSGVRVQNEELIKAGLNLPGFVERSEVIASLPSLSLLTLAALTPDQFDVSYHEIAEFDGDVTALPHEFDLVAISSFTAQIKEAYRIADLYRARGVPVVLGGLHVTVRPDEAQQHATSIVVGEGELLWPDVLRDFEHGELKPRYASGAHESFDLADAPIPRYDLLDVSKYNRLTVQTARGCPHQCDFCASSILLTPGYSLKPVDRIIDEVRRIKDAFPNPFIELADDNSFASKQHAKRLLRRLKSERVKWFTEADVSVAFDLELLDLMREAGCRQVLIGLESPTPPALNGIELRHNWKLRQFDRYEYAVEAIQSRGITVNGCFILGLDHHDERVFDEVHAFVDRTGLYEVQVTVLTPFPGTPLYDRLLREGRLIDETAWEKCTLFDVNFVPAQMSPEALQQGLIDLMTRLYAPDFARDRRERFFRQLRRGVTANVPKSA